MTLRINQRLAVVPGRALGDSRLDDRHLRVLAVLCLVEDVESSQGRDGWFEISHGAIAKLAGKSRSRVVGIVRDLVEAGYLDRRDQRAADRSKLANLYRVLYDVPLNPEHDRWGALTDDDGKVTPTPLLDWGEPVLKEWAGSELRKTPGKDHVTNPNMGAGVGGAQGENSGKHDVPNSNMEGGIPGKDHVAKTDMVVRERNMGDKNPGKHDVPDSNILRVESSLLPLESGIDSTRREASSQKCGSIDAAAPPADLQTDAERVAEAFERLRAMHFPRARGARCGRAKLRTQALDMLGLLPAGRLIEVLTERVEANAVDELEAPGSINRYRADIAAAAQLDREAAERRARAEARRARRPRQVRPEGWDVVFAAIGGVTGTRPTPDELAYLGVEDATAVLATPSKTLQGLFASPEILAAAARAAGTATAEVRLAPGPCRTFQLAAEANAEACDDGLGA